MGEEDRGAEKAAWRERFRRVRGDLGEAYRADASSAIVGHVLDLPEVEAAGVVHAYWPLVDRGEVDTRPLIEALAARGVTVVLPSVVPGPAPRMTHRRYTGADALTPGPWGVLEPDAAAPEVAPQTLDVVVVPGLAMGRDGSRLGYGGGYYDAFLAATDAFRVGVAWGGALVDAVPTEPHDARLDAVVTEAGVVRPAPPAPGGLRNPGRPRA